MTSPYTAYGYEDLREYAHNTYTHLALVDDAGSEITRIDVTSDGRVQNTPDASTNPLTYTVDIQGSDEDIPAPVTIVATRLYESANAAEHVGEDSMKDATVEALNDTLTVSHDQELPRVQ